MTKTTTVMGSPLYMSPEQMNSARDVDARTDIWALGAILYELLTGTVPFRADTLTQLCVLILQHGPPSLRALRPDAPEGLERVILRCLEKDRERRFATIAEFAQALAPYAPRRARISIERVSRVIESAGLGGSQPRLEDIMPPSVAIGAGSATGAAWGASGVSRRASGRTLALVLGGFALAGAAAAAGVFVLRGHAAKPEEPKPLVTAQSAATAGAPVLARAVEPAPAPSVTPALEPSAKAVTTAAPAPLVAPTAKETPATTAVAGATFGNRPLTSLTKAKAPALSGAPRLAATPAPLAATSPAEVASAKAAKKASLYDDRK